MAIGVGTSALIAQSVGAEDWEKAKNIAKKSTLFSSLAGFIYGLPIGLQKNRM